MTKLKKKTGFVGKVKAALAKKVENESDRKNASFVADLPEDTPEDILEMIQEYEKVKKDPRSPITGWDFERAFAFIDKYPDSTQATILLEEMQDTTSQTLKGLSYNSAIKVLEMIPSHVGAEAIIRGMYKLEAEYIQELTSDVIMFILEIAPDHPQREALGKALVYKNFTNAYAFIERHPLHPQTRSIIEMMFEKDPNIACLLLKEKMDHAQVDAIFEGIYAIEAKCIRQMMPDALIFILEVAPDHKYAKNMVATLVEKNYIKAFDFVKTNLDSSLSEYMKSLIIRKKPSLETLF